MTRTEKCELFYSRGYRYNPETGEITGIRGKVIKRKSKNGYIELHIGPKKDTKIGLFGHQFAWWCHYGEIHEDDSLVIDHDDRVKTNNRLSNLKLTTSEENNLNREWIETSKGYSFCKRSRKWKSSIQVEGKLKHLGYFDTEKEAREAYLTALAYYYPDRYKILEEKGLL
jgi:hypothetical protein